MGVLPVRLFHLDEDGEHLFGGGDVTHDLDVDGLVGEGQLLEEPLEAVQPCNPRTNKHKMSVFYFLGERG